MVLLASTRKNPFRRLANGPPVPFHLLARSSGHRALMPLRDETQNPSKISKFLRMAAERKPRIAVVLVGSEN